MRIARFAAVSIAAVALSAASAVTAPAPAPAHADDGVTTLTILHHGNGNSALLSRTVQVQSGGGTVSLPVGGAAAFAAVLDRERTAAVAAGHGVLVTSAGDSFLPSSTTVCSLDEGAPMYDAVAQAAFDFDVRSPGNQEFDLGPAFLDRFMSAFPGEGRPAEVFLAANLDFSGFPALAARTVAGPLALPAAPGPAPIAPSATWRDEATGTVVGVVGMQAWTLAQSTSLGSVRVSAETLAGTAAIAQQQVDALRAQGATVIIVLSHMRSMADDLALAALLRGVDVMVAGGTPALLNAAGIPDGAEFLPGETATPAGDYPMVVTGADGAPIHVVSTPGDYRYLGRLDLQLDAEGHVTGFDSATSSLKRVVPASPAATALGLSDAVTPDAALTAAVDVPLQACLDALATTAVAASEVALDVSFEGSRTRETNAGNLIADAMVAAYDRHAAEHGLPARGAANPVIGLQNGGGIRQTAGDVLPRGGAPGAITRLDTLDVLPFANPVVVVPGVSPADLKALFEISANNRFSPGDSTGGFLHVAGVRVVYDGSAAAGSRVREVTLADGRAVVRAGAVAAGAPSVTIVVNRFIAEGGNGYTMLASNTGRVQLPVTDDQAWRDYLAGLGTVSASDVRYAPGGEGRISFREGPAPAPPATGTGFADEHGRALAWAGLAALAAAAGFAAAARRRAR